MKEWKLQLFSVEAAKKACTGFAAWPMMASPGWKATQLTLNKTGI
jgi:hypothetical protein